jgi:hypothetical protein
MATKNAERVVIRVTPEFREPPRVEADLSDAKAKAAELQAVVDACSLDEYLGDPEAAKSRERLGRELTAVAARVTRLRNALAQAERRDTDARHRAEVATMRSALGELEVVLQSREAIGPPRSIPGHSNDRQRFNCDLSPLPEGRSFLRLFTDMVFRQEPQREVRSIMPKSIEDILVHIHDRPGEDENTKLGRIAREVDVHLVTFGRNTTPERLRLAKAFKDNNLGTRLGDRIVDLIHVP